MEARDARNVHDQTRRRRALVRMATGWKRLKRHGEVSSDVDRRGDGTPQKKRSEAVSTAEGVKSYKQ